MTDSTVMIEKNFLTQPKVEPKVEPKAQKAKRILKTAQPKIAPMTQPEGLKVKKFTRLVNDDRMQSVFTFKKSADSTTDIAVDVVFDFAGCNREQLLELATSSCRIVLQQRLRKMSDAAIATFAKQPQVVSVAEDLLASARVQRDPMDKLIADFARQSGITEAAARPKVEAMLREMRK